MRSNVSACPLGVFREDHVLPEHGERRVHDQHALWQYSANVTYLLKGRMGNTRSGCALGALREDHILPEDGRWGGQGQHGLWQSSEKITHSLRAENEEHKVSMHFGSVPRR